jgi:ubiquinone/menaquinone biosynthesis C-methylase UbiE
MNTRVYPELLDSLLGEEGDLPALPDNVKVLDLGAGTGNVTKRLVDSSQQRVVYALEPNRAMLEALKSKCSAYLATNGSEPRVIVLKQDVSSLFGLQDKSFDYAILSNVTYAISDPMPCYRSVRRVLRRGGELRLTGPRKDTRLDRLFRRIRQDLQARGVFEKYRDHYDRVERINRQYLDPMLHRWTTDDVKAQLLEAGFNEIVYTSDKAYAGQSMIVCAKR